MIKQPLIVIKTLLLALIGVALALFLGLPLPWMTGPLLLLSVLSLSGVKLAFINTIRQPIFALVGIYLGSSLAHQVVLFDVDWLYTAGLMFLLTYLTIVINRLYFCSFAAYNKEEAVLAALPGALAYIANYVIERNLSMAKIIIPQSVRVLIVVGLVPFIHRYLTGDDSNTINQLIWQPFALGWLMDLFILIVASVPSILLLRFLSIHNAYFLGGMLVSVLFYATGVSTYALPTWILQLLLILIGTMIGIRFAGTRVRDLVRYGWHGLVSTLLLLALTVITAWVGYALLDKDLIAMFLAFAPGGVHEMAIIAFAYSIEPVFVTFHHIIRISFISLLIPLLNKNKQ